jgi:hypothetical protein
MNAHEYLEITEVSFELTVSHRATASDPDPTEEDIRVAVERHLAETFDLHRIAVRRV